MKAANRFLKLLPRSKRSLGLSMAAISDKIPETKRIQSWDHSQQQGLPNNMRID